MKTRIIVAAVGLPLLLVVLIVLKPVFLTVLLAAMLIIAAAELFRAAGGAPNRRVLIVTMAFAALTPFAVYFGLGQVGFFAIFMPLMAYNFAEAIAVFGKEKKIKFEDILVSLFAGALIPWLLCCMLSLKMMEKGAYYVVMVCVITMISDSGGYFAGYFLGKHKVTPHVSPNKTLEGFIGSFLSAIAGLMLFGLIAGLIGKFSVNYLYLLIYAVCGNIFTQLGDLSFSLIKRQYGIKDYGNLLPGHGGILDRFDSMIFTAPVVYILIMLIPAF